MTKKLCIIQMLLLMLCSGVYASEPKQPTIQQVVPVIPAAKHQPAQVFMPPQRQQVLPPQQVVEPVQLPKQQLAAVNQPPLKRHKSDDDAEMLPAQDLQPKVFFNRQIEPIIKDLIVSEEGKIHAAYYEASSDKVLRWWAARKYIQEFEKARRTDDIDGIERADQYKKSHKEDLLIVDKQGIEDERDRRKLENLVASGVQVLVRTKSRQPANKYQSMHFKFMIFFHKDRPDIGKLVVTGSFNMTTQACEYNWEDIVILSDQESIFQYIAQLTELREYSVSLASMPK